MTHYADGATFQTLTVLANYPLAQDTMCVRLAAPEQMLAAQPGQFFMLRDVRSSDPLIGRAFALYDCNLQAGWLELASLVKGKLTRSIASIAAGGQVGVCGPLGNSFDDSSTDHLIMVAGGIGQTPFLTLTKEALGKQSYPGRHSGYAKRVSLCYGARSQKYFAGLDQFTAAGAQLNLATEDGSVGPPRRVTQALKELLVEQPNLSQTRIVCCGPEPMMEAVAKIAKDHEVPCQVSLETPMACGIGICFTCVAKVGTSEQWDYQRTCVEGPIFDAQRIVWH